MSNGLGAGFAALTLLAVLAGLAGLGVLSTLAVFLVYRRTDRVPTFPRYLLGGIFVAALAVAGFAVLALYDEAPAIAGLFALLVVFPLVVVSLHLRSTTELPPLDVVVTTAMAWGVPFLLGVVIVFGTVAGISSGFDLAPAETRRMGVPWIASTLGGMAIILGMMSITARFLDVVRSGRPVRD